MSQPNILKDLQLPDAYFIIQLSYGIPLIGFYIFLLAVIYSKPFVFSSSYFKITRAAAVCDMLFYVVYSLYYRLPANAISGPWFSSLRPSVFTTFVYWAYYYLKIQRLGYILLLTVNRGTAIVLPLTYHLFWRRYTHWTVLAVLLFPLSVTWSFFSATVFYNKINTEVQVQTMYLAFAPGMPNLTIFQHIFTLVLVVTAAAINGFCILRLYWRHKQGSAFTTSSSASHKASETALFLISLTESVIETMQAVSSIYIAFNYLSAVASGSYESWCWCFVNNSWLIDLTIFSRPLLLVSGSQIVRKTVFRSLRRDKATTASVIHPKSVATTTVRSHIVVVA